MKRSLKKEIEAFITRKPDIVKYFAKKGYSEGNVSEYCSNSMIPLYVVYFFLQQEGYDINGNLKRLCEFYQLENDYAG